MSGLVVFLVLGLSMLHSGIAMKCFTKQCTNQVCTGADNGTCTVDPNNPLLDPDHCMRVEVTIGGGQVDQRSCASAMQCTPLLLATACKAMNQSGTVSACKVGCCKGDLCNTDAFSPPFNPDPVLPDPISCYVCQTTPENPKACDNPTLEKCSPLFMGTPGVPNDRCMSGKSNGKDPKTGKVMALEIKNCTFSALCGGDKVCKMANMSTPGGVTDCTSTCCNGNGCNKKGAPSAGLPLHSTELLPFKLALAVVLALLCSLPKILI